MKNELWNLEIVRLGQESSPRLQVETLVIPCGVTAVIGKSGAGKTSLLNLLVGFEKPDLGTIAQPATATSVSWVPPDFGLWPHLTARQHLEIVRIADSPGVDEVLSAFDLSHLASQHPDSLSMGERSRLAVARSLATGAKIHVMDEPFAHVDSARLDRYWSQLRQQLRASQSSLVFATHAPEVVLREADHVICLESGSIIWTGAPRDLYDSPETEALATLMGPANWFDRVDEAAGVISEAGLNQCVRPAELHLTIDDDSDLVVQQTWHVGSYQQTEVTHTSDQTPRTLYHRPSESLLKPGTRVALQIVSTCLLFLFSVCLSGCSETNGEVPALDVQKSVTFRLPAEETKLPAPRGMTFSPTGQLFVLDDAGRVIVYDRDGNLSRRWWMPEYSVGKPEGAWVLKDGRIAVADTHYHRIVFFDKEGNVLSMFGEYGHGAGQFIYTVAVTQDDEGYLYVAEYGGNDRIQKFTSEGEFVTMFGSVGAEDGEFQRPSGLVWHDDVLYVADAINNRIQAFDSDGTFLRIVADAQTAGLYYPYDLNQAPDGSLFVAEYGAGRISRIALDGKVLGRYGQEGRGEGEFWTPWGIAVSRDGKVAVADTGNRRVVELNCEL